MLQLADAHFQPCQLISPRPTRWEKIDHSAFRGPGTGGCPVHAFGIYFYFYFFPGGGRQRRSFVLFGGVLGAHLALVCSTLVATQLTLSPKTASHKRDSYVSVS